MKWTARCLNHCIILSLAQFPDLLPPPHILAASAVTEVARQSCVPPAVRLGSIRSFDPAAGTKQSEN
jgi:hypothetical protein